MKKQVRVRKAVGIGGGIAALVAVELLMATGACAATPTVLESIKQCESGGNYSAVNPTSGASGAYQFLDSTWRALSASAGYATAASAPAAVQDVAALQLYNAEGTTPWISSVSCWGSGGTLTTASTSTATPITTTSTGTGTGTSGTTSATDPVVRPRSAADQGRRWDPARAVGADGGACRGGAGSGAGFAGGHGPGHGL